MVDPVLIGDSWIQYVTSINAQFIYESVFVWKVDVKGCAQFIKKNWLAINGNPDVEKEEPPLKKVPK